MQIARVLVEKPIYSCLKKTRMDGQASCVITGPVGVIGSDTPVRRMPNTLCMARHPAPRLKPQGGCLAIFEQRLNGDNN